MGDYPFGKAEIFFQPLKEVPYDSNRFDMHKPKSKYLLHIFCIASLVILMMAWINYINLTISSSNKRMKEIAARKTVGAGSKDFIIQFMLEAVVVNIISFLLALTFVQLFKLPADIFLQFYIPSWNAITLTTWIIISSVLLLGILLTGFYPAVITLKKSPKSLFNSSHLKTKGNNVSWILTTIQFTSALVLIIWVYTIHNQLTFILKRDIGLNVKQVLIVDLPIIPSKNFIRDIDQLTKSASALAGVAGYTVSNNVTAGNMRTPYFKIALGKNGPGITVDCNGGVDENFISFYGIRLLAGRAFQADRPSDKNSLLISRGAALRLGITKLEDAIGLRPEMPAGEIIGVFEDFTLRPLIYDDDNINFGGVPGIALTYKSFLQESLIPKKVSFRITSVRPDKTIEELRAIYNSIFPGNIFNWYFLEDQINNRYESDQTARNQIFFFSVLAIGIACLGLLGVITESVVKKVKEIGIRKVLGARLHHIAQVLLSATIKQIIVATVISIPMAYFLTHQYVEKFTERITLQWWHYMIPVALLLVIMFATIASVLYDAAKTNPVESLRYE
jgi:putative ABC transport system permease protein